LDEIYGGGKMEKKEIEFFTMLNKTLGNRRIQDKIINIVKKEYVSYLKQEDAGRVDTGKYKELYDKNKKSLNEKEEVVVGLETKISELKEKNKELKQNIQSLENVLKEKSEEAEKAAKDREALENQLKESNEKCTEHKKSLEQRFEKGWTLFQDYRKISVEKKQLLSSVFTDEDNFASFICGGAQDESLNMVWDVIRTCVLHEEYEDRDILWAIFKYCIGLVNISKTKAIYEILSPEKGVAFDLDLHMLMGNSRAQGKIIEVYLQGYKNTYNGVVERKSIVTIG